MGVCHMSEDLRNARANVIETTLGTSAKVRLRSGTIPANAAASSTGTLLTEIAMASNWAGDASGGVKVFANLPLVDDDPAASGDAGYWELLTSANVVKMRGDCGVQGSGATMILSTLSIVEGVPFSILAWTFREPHAGA